MPPVPASTRLRGSALLASTALVLSTLAVSAPAPAQPSGESNTEPASALVTAPEVEFDEPMNGPEAVRELGDDLDAVAAINDREPDELRDLLLEDDTTWVDTEGRLLVKDVAPHAHARTAPRTEARSATAAPLAPLADTFTLHSLPGSKRTIFLDFDGGSLTHTAWDTWEGVSGTYEGWDPAGNGPTFTDEERRLVQEVWATVAEDYAPYDVNVTTQDPGRAALSRSGPMDDVYGMHVLFSDSQTLHQKMGGGSTVGMAYLGTFDDVVGNVPVAPALVLTRHLADDGAIVGDVASHEVGHTLNLDHVDGVAGVRPATALYGPIMQQYVTRAAVTQWTVPDITAIPRGGLSLREDEAGGNAATAVPLPGVEVHGVISSASDQDWWTLTDCTDVTATASVAPYAPNLDIVLRLVDSTGTVVASDAPATTVSGGTVNGLSASLSHTVSGVHHLVVSGGGDGAGGTTKDYDAVGSIGAYTLQVSGCTHTATVPGLPRHVEATTTDAGQTTVRWQPPLFSGGADITGYRISVGGSTATVSGTARSHTLRTGAGRRQVSITAINEIGASSPVSIRSITTPRAAAHASLLRAPAAYRSHGHDRLLRWNGLDDGGSPVTALDLRRGSTTGTRLLEREEIVDWVANIAKKHDGQKYFVRFHNAAGAGQWKRFTLRLKAVTPRKPRALSVRHDSTSKRLTVTWKAPLDDGGAVITGHRVRVGSGAWRNVPTGTSFTLANVKAKGQPVRVAAVNRHGRGVVRKAPAIPAGAKKPVKGRVNSIKRGKVGGKKTLLVRWRPGKSARLPYTGHRLVVQHFNIRGKLVSTKRTRVYGKKRRTVEITRPKAGTYRVAVQSRNALGWGKRGAWSRKVRPR